MNHEDESRITRITDRLTLVHLDVRIWSGRKKLRPEDLRLGARVPPAHLVALGSKRICDKDALKPFDNRKKAAVHTLLGVGTRFLSGYAIRHDNLASVMDKLTSIQAGFYMELQAFLGNYERMLDDSIGSLPEFAEPIRAAVEPASYVAARMGFRFQAVCIAPAEHAGNLAEEIATLTQGIFGEVEQMARDLDEVFEGHDKLYPRSLGPFRRIRDKLDALSFVDPAIQPVVDNVDDWLRRLPAGPVSGPLFNEGMGLAMLLGDAQKMARHGQGQLTRRHGLATDDPDEPSALAAPAQQQTLGLEAPAATAPQPVLGDVEDQPAGPVSEIEPAPEFKAGIESEAEAEAEIDWSF